MPRKAMPLTAGEIKNAKYDGKPRKLFDGAGLFLPITDSGKYWRLKYRRDGKEKELTIGPYLAISLSRVRSDAQTARELLRNGVAAHL